MVDENLTAEQMGVLWNIPGWDWSEDDVSWLSMIFFIHGGRVRHQSHIERGTYTIDQFCDMVREKGEGLDQPMVCWSDTGDGHADLWVEGTRPPQVDDLRRLKSARESQLREDKISYMVIRKRHPEWFADRVQLDKHGRPF
jgi:hypothetical protein